MIGRKPTIIAIADEKQIALLMTAKGGRVERQVSLPTDGTRADDPLTGAMPKWTRQATMALLIVPDYWIGNYFFEFSARKRSIVAAFIARKLKQDHPSLDEAANFYDYALVQDPDRRRMLHCTYLQEPMAYALYRRLASQGNSPHRITTPALIWQSKLNRHIDGFADHGVGFVHLTDSDCFLYFYHLGQFLFSRHIPLPDAGDASSEIYNLLNYEINQSFYLYSQKSKRPVDTLLMLAQDPDATGRLAALLGRDVTKMPPSPPGTALLQEADAFSMCSGFSALDVETHAQPSISYTPLRKEMTWRPVQWAGIAVGICLVVFLAMEAGYLHLLQRGVHRQQSTVFDSSSTQQPEQVLSELTQILEDITGELGRPSGSDVVMRTLLAMPKAVSLQKLSLDTSAAPRLTIDAWVDADHPDRFKAVLDAFLNRLNQRFNLEHRPLRDKDIRIGLERQEKNDRQPLYQIHFSFELT